MLRKVERSSSVGDWRTRASAGSVIATGSDDAQPRPSASVPVHSISGWRAAELTE